MNIDEAVRYMRANSQYAELIDNAYLGANVAQSAERFEQSPEFSAVEELVGTNVRGGAVLDLGAGTGIASWAFAKRGARVVYALEPDPSEEVGSGAMQSLIGDMPIQLIASYGEKIPLDDEVVDVVYARQVLHHANDLPRLLRECARILKSGGLFLACREHVVNDQQQLRAFLNNHPVHQLAGGENAYKLDEYTRAILLADLKLEKVLGPWDTIINTFPTIKTVEELNNYPRMLLQRRLGRFGVLASRIPAVNSLVWRRLKQPLPGRLYSFLAVKT